LAARSVRVATRASPSARIDADAIALNPQTLEPGGAEIVRQRLQSVLAPVAAR
jgi:hypothetical protein